MMLTDLAEACRKSGLTVVELPGWQRRGRPASTGGFNPRGVLCHHTGSYDDITDAANDHEYADWMATVGRSDLPAPLCHLALSAEGVVYVCAASRANHAGTARATGPMPAGDGNELYVGIEAMNSGSQGWSPVQYGAYVRLCASLCRHYGWPARNVRAHRETSVTGKWDPGLLDMPEFRGDIAREINNPSPTDSAEDIDMKLDEVINPKAAKKDQLTVAEALRISANTSLRNEEWIRRLRMEGRAQTSALRKAIDRGASHAELRQMLDQLEAALEA